MLAQISALSRRISCGVNISKRCSDKTTVARAESVVAQHWPFAERQLHKSAPQTMLRRTAISSTPPRSHEPSAATPLFAANAAKNCDRARRRRPHLLGKPSKKGVGSRGTPHRLNEAERAEYAARTRGLWSRAVRGGKKRKALMHWRNWCDAVALPISVRRY